MKQTRKSAMSVLVRVLSLAALSSVSIACEIMGNPAWDRYCTHGASVSSSNCASGCATGNGAPMSMCCTEDCCSAPSPPTPTPSPTPTPTPGPPPASDCDGLGETACYSKPGCGYCISNNYDSGCIAGDMTGPFFSGGSSATAANCDRQWTAGVYRTPESMCVIAVGEDDVRCYKDCTYGLPGQAETFVVPSQAACNQYDTAYTAVKTEADLRQEVHDHVAGYLLSQAVVQSHVELLHRAGFHEHALRSNSTWHATHMLNISLIFPNKTERDLLGLSFSGDLTRELLHSKLLSLEQDGLSSLETAACEGVCTPCAPFCATVFESTFATMVNKQVLEIPVVQNINSASHAMPPVSWPLYMDTDLANCDHAHLTHRLAV